ncbi:3-carboxyethylcatechol 2,3-dioxygenase (plasmid) [Pseudomonas sp. App30]|uniref:3-carboxyethylcatechol 2,3-dioxygenase n=1 Tax=Pseudomonas sp. App30 TaxID=3068990 RepID=UPI003A806A8A
MSVLLHCLSHTPLVGLVDPPLDVLAEIDAEIASARERIAAFDPELVILFAPDHYNGFFYDVMPAFCVGIAAEALGDFGSEAGVISVPQDLAEQCASAVLNAGVDVAVSYRMQVDHGFAQPLELLLGGLSNRPTIPVFINCLAKPMPSFQRVRLLGEAVGRFAQGLNKRVLVLGSGGLSHQPPVPELATANPLMRDRLLGSGRNLTANERDARTQRVIDAAHLFIEDQNSLHPLNPEWDQYFLDVLQAGHIGELDGVANDDLSAIAGKSTHEVKAWVAAFAALSAFGPYTTSDRYYRPIPEWIAGFGALSGSTTER